MPLDKQSTTLRQSPYFDDYDETKNFHRVLFKPSVAVQARELTQLQTILQNQIERFGDNIYQTGTIIKGCSLTTDDNYNYVKLFDLQPNGSTYSLALMVNTYVVDAASNLQALVVNYAPGGQQLDPDLNTLYLKYLNTGTGGQKEYSNSAVLTVYNRDYRIESIAVNDGGTQYSNNDVILFGNTTGTGAVAQIITYANGSIRSISMTSHGSGYYTIPTVSIRQSSNLTLSSTGSGANLSVYNYAAQVQVANNVYTNPVGRGSAIKTTEGIVYQKGHFIRVEPHEQLLSKYNTTPTGVVVGFVTTESVVNSNSDQTLLDNASGTTNYTAPGADRLKLTANLAVVSTANAASNSQFLALYEYEDGRVVKDRTVTQFNTLSSELSRRTYEESGNYVVNSFPMYSEAISGNTTHLNLTVGAGVAYVQGNRVQLMNTSKYPIRKSTDTTINTTQTISTSGGGWVMAKRYVGTFDIKTATNTVSLYSGATTSTYGTGVSTPSGVQIGTARVRSITYDSGIAGTEACQYRLYLFDVKLSTGFSFKDVRAVHTSTGVCDLVVDSALGYVTQYDTEFDRLIFDTGTFAVKQLDNEVVVSRTSTTGAFAPAGTLAVSLGGGSQFVYGDGVLNSVQERDFIVVPSATIVSGTDNTGNVAITATSNVVTGTGTSFTTEYTVGQFIKIGLADGGTDIGQITKIISASSMQCAAPFVTTASNQKHRYAYPANTPIDLSPSSKTVTISANSAAISINLGQPIGYPSSSVNTAIYHDSKVISPSVRVKTANTYYTKISTARTTASNTGPWCLGIPDVVQLVGVYKGTSNSYANNTTTNYVNDFILDNGQRDNFYDLASISKRPGSTLSISSTDCLTVEYKAFTHDVGAYISTESYTSSINDSTVPLPFNKIRTQDIPVYTSPKTGKSFDLRDVIDFRPLVSNTAVYATSISAASVDPSNTVSFTGSDKQFPSPTQPFTASLTSYLSRRDRVVIDSHGQLRIVEGYPSNTPSVPQEPEGSMTVGTVDIPQYPSLSAKQAADSGRPDLGVYVTPQQNRRYTMKDISDIETRIGRLEYYTLLNTLETTTKQLVLPSEANNAIERFKNGFFVDPLTDYNVSNLQDPEYKILIDPNKGIARPYFTDVNINLKFDPTNSSHVQQTGDLVTMSYTTQPLLSQQIATRDRTLVTNQWRYGGTLKTVPAFDNYYDVDASSVSIAIDIASPLNALAQSTAAALSQLKVSTNLLSTVNVGSSVLIADTGALRTYEQNVSKTFQDTKVTIGSGAVSQTNTSVGTFVNDIALQQYIREQRIGFFATGLRPGAEHYAFFDGNNVSSRVTPARVDLTISHHSVSDFTTIGTMGAALVANSSGCIAAFFDVPARTYFVGERTLAIMDVDNLQSEDTATSKSVGKFTAYDFKVATTKLSVSTKSIEVTAGSFAVNNYLSSAYSLPDKYYWSQEVPTQDPLSQTFLVQPQEVGTDGVFVTGVDVYFKSKDDVQGVHAEIRETNNDGSPSQVVVPFSRSYLPSSAVQVSNNASVATSFTFPSPVYLKTNSNYALTLYPDSNSPEYRVYTAVVGGADVTNPNIVTNNNWGLGTLFYSSGSAWTAVQDEDLKFTLHRAVFNATSGNAVLHNDDYEFLTVANTNGTVRGGEAIAQLHPTNYLDSTITTSIFNEIITTGSSLTTKLAVGDDILIIYGGSQTLANGTITLSGTAATGNGTALSTDYMPGHFIKFGNSSVGQIRQVIAAPDANTMTIDCALTGNTTNLSHYKISPTFQVARVKAITANTITLDKRPTSDTSATLQATIQKAVAGVVDSYNYSNNRIYIAKSTSANDTFKFLSSNSTYRGTIVGDLSQATATVASIDDIDVNYFRPMFNSVIPSGTGLTLSGTLTTGSGGTQTDVYQYGTLNKVAFNDNAKVKSKSNEIVGTVLTKSFTANVSFDATSGVTSPILDIAPTSIVATRNMISANTTGEDTKYGDAQTKYISKRLELAAGMDAEDVKVYLTAYKPAGTDIDVYAKVLNSTDGESFDSKGWTLLNQVTSASVYSDSLNEEDYREFEYTFPLTPPSFKISGYCTTNSNTTITGANTSFNTELAVGDMIKVVRSSTTGDYDVTRVTAIANTTSLTVATAVSFSATGVTIEKITQPRAAFKYNRNSNIVRYHDANGAAYDTYRYLAVKVVLRSPYAYLVPTLNDVRALAVSI